MHCLARCYTTRRRWVLAGLSGKPRILGAKWRLRESILFEGRSRHKVNNLALALIALQLRNWAWGSVPSQPQAYCLLAQSALRSTCYAKHYKHLFFFFAPILTWERARQPESHGQLEQTCMRSCKNIRALIWNSHEWLRCHKCSLSLKFGNAVKTCTCFG